MKTFKPFSNGHYGSTDSFPKFLCPIYNDYQDDKYNEGLIAVKLGDYWGYVDYYGEIIIPFSHFSEANCFKNGYASVGYRDTNNNVKWGFINLYGNPISENYYDLVGQFSNGLAIVAKAVTPAFGLKESQGYKYGYIDSSGKEVIPLIYDGVHDFDFDCLAQVNIDNVDYTINKTGEIHFSEGLSPVIMNKKYGYINESNEIIIKPQFEYAGNFKNGVSLVLSPERQFYTQNDFVHLSAGYRFINNEGEFLGLIYGWAEEFSFGFALVRELNDDESDERGNYGFINNKFELVVQYKYSTARSFKDGLAAVSDNEMKWGFINTELEELVPIQYDEVSDFYKGFAKVRKNEAEFFIDIKGNEIKTVIESELARIRDTSAYEHWGNDDLPF